VHCLRRSLHEGGHCLFDIFAAIVLCHYDLLTTAASCALFGNGGEYSWHAILTIFSEIRVPTMEVLHDTWLHI
jgi:hypothetical protein